MTSYRGIYVYSVCSLFVIIALAGVSTGRAELDGFEDDVDLPEEIIEHVSSPPKGSKAAAGFVSDTGKTSSNKDTQSNIGIKKSQTKRTIEWDEDEFEGVPPVIKPKVKTQPVKPAKKTVLPQWMVPGPATPQKHYYYEMGVVAFIVIYAINYLWGSRQNDKLAFEWICTFAKPDATLVKNFHLIGHNGDAQGWGETPLTREAPYEFKLYASGRQYCKHLTATLQLNRRNDLYSRLWNFVFPSEDMVNIDVVMNEENMEPLCFAVARNKKAKTMHKDCPDLEKYTSMIQQPDKRKHWVSSQFTVLAESAEVADALLVDSVIETVLSEKALAPGSPGEHLQWLHFSDQSVREGQHLRGESKVLSFGFTLPARGNMHHQAKLIEMVPRYIDAVARLVLSASAKAKAAKARAQVEQEAFKNTYSERQHALWRRKADKKAAEAEAEASMSKEAIRKKEERDRRRQMKKSEMKMKLIR